MILFSVVFNNFNNNNNSRNVSMATLSEGIVKINSKVLEQAELKKLDKQEKETILLTHSTVNGKK